MRGWHLLPFPKQEGLVASSKVVSGVRSNRIVHGSDGTHRVWMRFRGPSDAIFDFTAILDPTDGDRSPAPSSSSEGNEAAARADISTADSSSDRPTTPTATDDSGDRSKPLVSLYYTDLRAARRWRDRSEIGPGLPSERNYEEVVFHDDGVYECQGGREHLVRVDATVQYAWPDAPVTKQSIEFVVTCKPA